MNIDQLGLDLKTFSQENKNAPIPFTRTELGSSGATFIPKDTKIPYVVKFQSKIQSETEYLANKFYRKLVKILRNFEVPKTKLATKNVSKFSSLFKKLTTLEIPSESTLIIDYKEGATLYNVERSHTLFSLSDEDLRKIFFSIGQISGLDFYTGNCDRFIPKKFRGVINPLFRINNGNILIELSTEGQNTLKKITLIDNGPGLTDFFDFDERKGEEIEDDNNNGIYSLFEDEREPVLEKTIPETSQNQLMTGEQTRMERQADLEYFLHADDARLYAIAKQIYFGVLKSIEEDDKIATTEDIREVFAEDSSLIDEIRKGLDLTKKELRCVNVSEILDKLFSKAKNFHPTPKKYLHFLNANLNLTREVKNGFCC
ncbi:MAG: hypothetical protein ACOYL1_05025 [Chlamydiia bacterium]